MFLFFCRPMFSCMTDPKLSVDGVLTTHEHFSCKRRIDLCLLSAELAVLSFLLLY